METSLRTGDVIEDGYDAKVISPELVSRSGCRYVGPG